MTSPIMLYRGEPVENLTREELLEVIKELAALLEQERAQAAEDRDFLLGGKR